MSTDPLRHRLSAEVIVLPDASTEVITDLDAAPPDPDDHEPFAHIVGQWDLEAALLRGGTVRALCGHEFNPKLFNPAGLPVCPACKQISSTR